MNLGRIHPRERIVKAAISCILWAGIAAVFPPTSAAAGDKKFTVVTTFTVIQDIAQNVAGDAATVVSITRPGAEIHNYEPTPRDIVRAQRANLILWNGMNLESWFTKFFANLKNVPGVVVSEGIQPIPIRSGAYASKPNPHAWMSTHAVKVYVRNIERALAKYDSRNAAVYSTNADRYIERIDNIEKRMRDRLQALPSAQRWLVTSEGAFSYLARDLGFKEAYLWPINAEQQGTPQQVRALIDLVRREKIPVVFSESTVSDKPARQVAKETGARYGGVLYVDSLSEASGPVPTYLRLLEKTVDTIAQGFGR